MEKIADYPLSRFKDIGMLRWTSNYITRAQEDQMFEAMQNGDLDAEARLEQAYNALTLELEEAKKVLNNRGKDYTMVAWKLKLMQEAEQPGADPDLKEIVNGWEKARAAYIPRMASLKGKEGQAVKDEWGRADRALTAEVMKRIQIVFCDL